MTPPVDYAAIAARAVAVEQRWAEPHVARLAVRLLMAGLIYEAILAACAVHGLVYEGFAHEGSVEPDILGRRRSCPETVAAEAPGARQANDGHVLCAREAP